MIRYSTSMSGSAESPTPAVVGVSILDIPDGARGGYIHIYIRIHTVVRMCMINRSIGLVRRTGDATPYRKTRVCPMQAFGIPA